MRVAPEVFTVEEIQTIKAMYEAGSTGKHIAVALKHRHTDASIRGKISRLIKRGYIAPLRRLSRSSEYLSFRLSEEMANFVRAEANKRSIAKAVYTRNLIKMETAKCD